VTKNCLNCNKEFAKKISESIAYFSTKRFCSHECFDSIRRNKPSPSPKTAFKKGQKVFVPNESRRKGKDNNMWTGGPVSIICKICSRQFSVNRSRIDAKTCSPECKHLYQRSPERREAIRLIHRERVLAGKHNLYRGVTALYTLIRKSAQYKEWRTRVFNRDGFRCVECGRNGELHADHVRQFAIILIENDVNSIDDALKCVPLWDINNGRTLCVPCHKETATYGNHGAFTRQSRNHL